jgi:hypothetical protein
MNSFYMNIYCEELRYFGRKKRQESFFRGGTTKFKKIWVLFFDVTHRAMFFMRLPNTKFARAQLLSAVWT